MRKKKKKTWLVVLIVIIVLGAIASAGKKDKEDSGKKDIVAGDTSDDKDNNDSDDNEEASDKTEQTSEKVTIEEQLLFEKDGLKVTATEYKTDSIWGDGINLLIENDSDKSIGLGCTALIVNDYMIFDLFTSTVAAGKKSNEMMYLSSSELEAAGIDNVGKVEIYFHTFDPDTYMTIEDFDCVTIETSAINEIDTTPNDAGQELFNSNGIRIVGKYVDEKSFWGAGVLLYIENTSGQNVIVQCDDMSINGFMVTPYFSANVYDGKKAIDEITILSSDLEDNNITSVDDIELVFKIIDANSYNRIETSEPISFSTK